MFDITNQDNARTLIATLRTVYAAQFNKHFPSSGKDAIPMQIVEKIAAGTLTGVRQDQFDRGLVILVTSAKTFMPSFAEFRAMCIGHDWWTPEKAWVKACEYTKITDHKPVKLADGSMQYQEITTLAKFALDQVALLIQDGEMYRAKVDFIKLYDEYLAEAQLKGRVQEWYQEPKFLASKNKEKPHAPISNSEAHGYLTALMSRLNIKNRLVPTSQKIKPQGSEVIVGKEYGPDPFENPAEYAEMCRRDGQPISKNVLKLLEG